MGWLMEELPYDAMGDFSKFKFEDKEGDLLCADQDSKDQDKSES